jgi:hypothetical protein
MMCMATLSATMRVRRTVPLLGALCLLASGARAQEAAAAATAATADTAAAKPRKRGRPKPPLLLTSTRPDLVLTSRVPGRLERSQSLIELRVDIDAMGMPDMSTLRVTGPGASENRPEIVRWLESVKFEPARDAEGNAMPGEFRLRLSVGGR